MTACRGCFTRAAIKKSGGSAWESNPPATLDAPHTGFEVRGTHQDPTASLKNAISHFQIKYQTSGCTHILSIIHGHGLSYVLRRQHDWPGLGLFRINFNLDRRGYLMISLKHDDETAPVPGRLCQHPRTCSRTAMGSHGNLKSRRTKTSEPSHQAG